MPPRHAGILLILGWPLATGCDPVNGPVVGPQVPKKSPCGEIVTECYDELSRIPADLVVFRPQARWPRTNLTWTIEKYLSDVRIRKALQTEQARKALTAWALVTPLSFRSVDEVGQADLVISFEARDHGDPFPFDGIGGVRGHAFFPGTSKAGRVHLDSVEEWTVGAEGSKTDLFTILVHEIGHALGLEHDPSVNVEDDGESTQAVMAPGYPPKGIGNLGSQDIAAIQNLYGSADGTIKPSFIASLRAAPSGLADPDQDDDSDKDGIPDSLEIFVFETDPFEANTDGDALNDFDEIFRAGTSPGYGGEDFDQDGLPDSQETDIGTRPNRPDTDMDGVFDGKEVFFNTDPLKRDTDGDGIDDGIDAFPTLDDCLFLDDCNGNGTSDPCDIREGFSRDLNSNGVPDECDACVTSDDCDDGLFCNGRETCGPLGCQDGTAPCAPGTACKEDTDQCVLEP